MVTSKDKLFCLQNTLTLESVSVKGVANDFNSPSTVQGPERLVATNFFQGLLHPAACISPAFGVCKCKYFSGAMWTSWYMHRAMSFTGRHR